MTNQIKYKTNFSPIRINIFTILVLISCLSCLEKKKDHLK